MSCTTSRALCVLREIELHSSAYALTETYRLYKLRFRPHITTNLDLSTFLTLQPRPCIGPPHIHGIVGFNSQFTLCVSSWDLFSGMSSRRRLVASAIGKGSDLLSNRYFVVCSGTSHSINGIMGGQCMLYH